MRRLLVVVALTAMLATSMATLSHTPRVQSQSPLPLPSPSTIIGQTHDQICATFRTVEPTFIREQLLAQAGCSAAPQAPDTGGAAEMTCVATTVAVGEAILCEVNISVPQTSGETITSITLQLAGTGRVRLVGGPNGVNAPQPASVLVISTPGPQSIEVNCTTICNDPNRVLVYQFAETITGEVPGTIQHQLYINGTLRHTLPTVITVTSS